MHEKHTAHASLTLLLGTPITDRQGRVQGRLKDVAVATGPSAGNVAGLLLKTREGAMLVAVKDLLQTPAGTLELREDAVLQPCAAMKICFSCSRTCSTGKSSTCTAEKSFG